MPPRVPFLSGLRVFNGPSSSTSQTCRTFTSTSVDQASAAAQKKRHRDPYILAQARARKAANVSRQQVLKEKRTEALGDPVRGITTPFIQSFDNAAPPPPTPQTTTHTHTIGRDQQSASPNQPAPGPNAENESHLNFYLTQDEIRQSLSHSEMLIAPVPRTSFGQSLNDDNFAEDRARRQDKHATATEAMRRIASLANGSSKDRLRVNIQRCITTFGRHNTDQHLDPKPAVAESMLPKNQLEKVPRAGPDTGSSEVQVAILTAKIRTLADFLETRGPTDKINKRNLRVLVHKRQKHLTYLRRKERGGPRWQNLIETLGLTEGTWKGEISL